MNFLHIHERKEKVVMSAKEPITPITCDIKTLMMLTGLGRVYADQIGVESGAKIRIGRRCLYRVADVQRYLDGIKSERGITEEEDYE